MCECEKVCTSSKIFDYFVYITYLGVQKVNVKCLSLLLRTDFLHVVFEIICSEIERYEVR